MQLRKIAYQVPLKKSIFYSPIDAEIDLLKVERAIQLSIDKYCSVKASLNTEIKISYGVIIL